MITVSVVALIVVIVVGFLARQVIKELRLISKSLSQITENTSGIVPKLDEVIDNTSGIVTKLDEVTTFMEEVKKILPRNTDDFPPEDMMKEVYRRKMFLTDFMKDAVDVVAAGVSKALSKK